MSTKFKVGQLYEDWSEILTSGFYLLLSYDYEKDIDMYCWRTAYFAFYIKEEDRFKGAYEKKLTDKDIERLKLIGNISQMI